MRLVGPDVVGEDGAVHSVRSAIEGLRWRSSLPGGGMPPHQDVVLGQCEPLAADVVLCVLRESPTSFLAYFRGYPRPMRYVELDGWRYWRTALNRAHMLNRCALDSLEPPRRVDKGARPIPWDGPPWALSGSPWPPGFVEVAPGQWVYESKLDPRRRYVCASCGRSYWLSSPDRPCPHCATHP